MLDELAHGETDLVPCRIDATKDRQHHHILQLLVAQSVLVSVGLEEKTEEIISRRAPALLDQSPRVLEQSVRRSIHRFLLGAIGDTECKTHSAYGGSTVSPIRIRQSKK